MGPGSQLPTISDLSLPLTLAGGEASGAQGGHARHQERPLPPMPCFPGEPDPAPSRGAQGSSVEHAAASDSVGPVRGIGKADGAKKVITTKLQH